MENVKENDIFTKHCFGHGRSLWYRSKEQNEVILLQTYPRSAGEYILKIRHVKNENVLKFCLKSRIRCSESVNRE